MAGASWINSVVLKRRDHEQGIVHAAREVAREDGITDMRLHTGRPWLSPSSRSLPAHDRPAGIAGKHPPARFHLVIDIHEAGEPPKPAAKISWAFKDDEYTSWPSGVICQPQEKIEARSSARA